MSAEIDQQSQLIRDLAKFPSENPNPILRVAGEGGLLYANDAARALDGILEGPDRNALTEALAISAVDAYDTASRRELDLICGARAFAFTLTPIAGETYVNVYGRDITEERRAIQETRDLAKFPSENPNPILRMSGDGEVLYANEAAHALDGLLADGEVLRGDLAGAASEAFKAAARRQIELGCGDRIYAFTLAPVTGERYLNVYGRDITEEQQAKEQLLAAKNSLEQRVKERTASVRLLQSVVIAANQAATMEEALRDLPEGGLYLYRVVGWPCLSPGRRRHRGVRRLGNLAPGIGGSLRRPARGHRRCSNRAGGGPLRRRPGERRTGLEPRIAGGRNTSLAKVAREVGLNAALAFPVLLDTEVVAVLEFFATEPNPPDAETLTAMGHIGTQLVSVHKRGVLPGSWAGHKRRVRGWFDFWFLSGRIFST